MAKPDLEVRVVVELDLSDRTVTAVEAKRIEAAMKTALRTVYPEHRLRGLWVHSKPPSGGR